MIRIFATIFLCTICTMLVVSTSPPTVAQSSSNIDKSDLPPLIRVPPQHTVEFSFKAQGFQIYKCVLEQDSGKLVWSFVAPEAELFDQAGKQVGRHFAGPAWKLDDGSEVLGKLKVKTDAPDGSGIPWLLLEAQQRSGRFGAINLVQRVHTNGGAPPPIVGDEKIGSEIRVPYKAEYRFLR
jgi:hypothetical protein